MMQVIEWRRDFNFEKCEPSAAFYIPIQTEESTGQLEIQSQLHQMLRRKTKARKRMDM